MMKLVIEIPEEIRLALINNIQLSIDQQSICDACMKQAIVNGKPLSEEYREADTKETDAVRQELLERGDEMISFRDLVERFDEVEEYFKGIPWTLKQIYANFNILIGEKPCEDAISRQAVIDYIRDNYRRWFINDDAFIQCMNGIKDFISVTPQSKMGHWFVDERPESDREIICSNCEQPIFKYHKMDFDYRPNFCPNCGTKMREVEE